MNLRRVQSSKNLLDVFAARNYLCEIGTGTGPEVFLLAGSKGKMHLITPQW
jgi:hypothetical protein